MFETIMALMALGITLAFVLLAVTGVLAIYFAPFIVAYCNNAKHKWWILGLTVLFGTLIIPWIGLLIWAFMDERLVPLEKFGISLGEDDGCCGNCDCK